MIKNDKYLFFLRGFLSQWHKAPMSVEGIKYNCCEQYMMHQKALFFNDLEAADAIMKVESPYTQKAIGRDVKGYDDAKWAAVRYKIVVAGNMAKFTQNRELKHALLDTGYLELVEANPRDSIWGIGKAETDEDLLETETWGQNLLGKALMEVRGNIIRSLDNKIY